MSVEKGCSLPRMQLRMLTLQRLSLQMLTMNGSLLARLLGASRCLCCPAVHGFGHLDTDADIDIDTHELRYRYR